jgi:formate hydrogenlyase transcriptional activator
MQIEESEGDEKRLVRRLRFEEMVSDISARFMAIPVDQVDFEIDNALREIMEFFQVDRCGLLEIHEDRAFVRVTHVAQGEGVEQISGDINLAELFPWCYKKLLEGEPINICQVGDYPEDALRDRQSHEAMGIQSALNIPVAIGGRIATTIVINLTRRHQTWPEEHIPRLCLLGQIFAFAMDRRKDRLRLEEQLRFEMLLAEISGRFVNLPADRIDRGIEDAQRRICELLNVDRSTLWQISEKEPAKLLLTHIHQPAGSLPPVSPMDAGDFFPWATQKILSGEDVVLSKIADLPPEAARDRENFRAYGTRSNVVVPLSVGEGPVFGMVAFAVMREERKWTESVLRGFKLIAQLFANVLVRQRNETALCENEERLSLTTEAVGAGLWITEVDTGKVWVSPKGRELFHFVPHEEITYERYLGVIHPEDRDRINRDVQRALQSGEALHCDYRIALPDGNTRWIGSRGRRFQKSTGESQRILGLSLDITARKQMEIQLADQVQEIEQLRQRLERENIYLRDEVRHLQLHDEIVGNSDVLRHLLLESAQVAATDSTVLILGETGTGKELLARAIHNMSSRKDHTLVTVNCSSLPPTLIESELFGREKGAYTGALTRMLGRFEVADGSALFLDEIGDLPLELQGKLLRVLEYGTFERLGSARTIRVNVRIIAATNRDLSLDVNEGKFRKDLYYRLNVFPLVVPPLRARKEDITPLVWAFVRQLEKSLGKRIARIPKKSMDALLAYPWPGNIRELRNVIEHAMIVGTSTTLNILPPAVVQQETGGLSTLEEVERKHILHVLERTNWRISGKNSASEILGMKRTTLQSKMKSLGIARDASP